MPIYKRCTQCGKKILQGNECECRKIRYKEYNKTTRYNEENKQYSEFYNSKSWKRMSKHIKRKYNGLCLMCLLKYKDIIAMDLVHHIEPIRVNYDKRLKEDNLIPLCHRCHNSIDHIDYPEELKEELKSLLKEYKKIYSLGGC